MIPAARDRVLSLKNLPASANVDAVIVENTKSPSVAEVSTLLILAELSDVPVTKLTPLPVPVVVPPFLIDIEFVTFPALVFAQDTELAVPPVRVVNIAAPIVGVTKVGEVLKTKFVEVFLLCLLQRSSN